MLRVMVTWMQGCGNTGAASTGQYSHALRMGSTSLHCQWRGDTLVTPGGTDGTFLGSVWQCVQKALSPAAEMASRRGPRKRNVCVITAEE